ncbi:uncharacterized protein KY384_006951 [Bacidia gigantensis]|uniref:uncharacterized protein n=1 Tax=Bacidia gigantensis TaxID=2732470 RepID=UPI001D040E76|nr:uncharacterized protein KY384_006951 [Bacidia gigantensis]KAG8528035.1 hypothetical protein KY384_006951 [Bacidia gigantensis]
MNSLNLLSERVIGQNVPSRTSNDRPRSYSDGTLNRTTPEPKPKRSSSQHERKAPKERELEDEKIGYSELDESGSVIESSQLEIDEKTPLLREQLAATRTSSTFGRLRLAAKRLVHALTTSIRWVLSTLASPFVYLVGSFQDEKGRFSVLLPVRKIGKLVPKRNGQKSTAQAIGLSGSSETYGPGSRSKTRAREVAPNSTGAKRQSGKLSTPSSESNPESRKKSSAPNEPQTRHLHLHTSSSSDELPQNRRSTRIKHNNEESTRRRKQKKSAGGLIDAKGSTRSRVEPSLTVRTIKSPTSPVSSVKSSGFSRLPAPPRPLIPPRQPSYSTQPSRSSRLAQKTLVIDLDETLIHSLAKGGRMSSGHMVEVKLNTTVGYGAGTTLGPQHPILYYVHKRPHCDDFLRKVCKWYNLVVFTASVQEYADPVIDWLEQERNYFSGRYYRQHCTFRNGAYIKDLSSIEPDLSRVMILDNSPLSYIFHEDNAIPIEGWINDPTDNDLLHLVPILEALQYVTDVRTLLALRRGELDA